LSFFCGKSRTNCHELTEPKGFPQTNANTNSERKKIQRSKPLNIEYLAKHDYFKDENENFYRDEAEKNINEGETAVNGEDDAENFSSSYHVKMRKRKKKKLMIRL